MMPIMVQWHWLDLRDGRQPTIASTTSPLTLSVPRSKRSPWSQQHKYCTYGAPICPPRPSAQQTPLTTPGTCHRAPPRHPSSLLFATAQRGSVAVVTDIYLDLAQFLITPHGAWEHRENNSVTMGPVACAQGNVNSHLFVFYFDNKAMNY
jgi:hypothetical protein